MTDEKPFAPSTDRNKDPILEVLRAHLSNVSELLELGSGTGQHAVHMAAELEHIQWQTSDLPDQHLGMNAWIDDAKLPNVKRPLALDVSQADWPDLTVGAVYTANTAHIMSWGSVCEMFRGTGEVLVAGGLFLIYGPFSYAGSFTSSGNRDFDESLRARDPASGIRDFEALEKLAADNRMTLVDDVDMPANNRLLVWRKN
ncbi:MAG: cyclopropane fatty-acyl-phospholipid synthase-like methyltransferase [Gammaproteobacteria bacterium]|jgi:cyclopropane fatty-acyl-phospholipid synthase-like methyltransferase